MKNERFEDMTFPYEVPGPMARRLGRPKYEPWTVLDIVLLVSMFMAVICLGVWQ